MQAKKSPSKKNQVRERVLVAVNQKPAAVNKKPVPVNQILVPVNQKPATVNQKPAAVNQNHQQHVSETAKQKVRERVLVPVNLQETSEPSNKGSSSPLLDDFDEDLCFELEEVGKELDRYKEEASQSPDLRNDPHDPTPKQSSPSSNTASSTFSTPSPPLSPLPVAMYDDTIKCLSHDAHSPTRLVFVTCLSVLGKSQVLMCTSTYQHITRISLIQK